MHFAFGPANVWIDEFDDCVFGGVRIDRHNEEGVRVHNKVDVDKERGLWAH